MKNNKGFTLIEIITTFSVITVVITLLFQIIISLRELYIKGDLQTTLLTKQGIITKKINDDLKELKLASITSCGAFCITFHYQTGVAYNLSLNIENNQIIYHDYTWELPEGARIGTVNTTVYKDASSATGPNAILKIEVPISHKLLEKDYGLFTLYQYNANAINIPTVIPKPAGITDAQHQQYSFFR